MPERRRFERLRDWLSGKKPRPSCVVEVGGETRLDCELSDLSCGGMRLAVVDPEARMGLLHEGQRVQVVTFASARYAFLAGRSGILCWVRASAGEMGITFDEFVPKVLVESVA